MTITMSSSMKVLAHAQKLAIKLESFGHTVHRPFEGSAAPSSDLKLLYMQDHLNKLQQSDALFVANIKASGDTYGIIGSSTFFEIGWAFALLKKVFIYEPFDPAMPIAEDLLAVQPVVCNGILDNVKD